MRGPALVSQSVLYRYVGAVLTAALAVGLRLALNPMLGRDVPYIVNFFAIAVAAWLFGFGPALVTTLTLQMAIGWIYLGPLASFTVFARGDQVSLVISTVSAIGIALIVHSLRQTQRDLQREKETAERANEAKDRFLSMVSHELRNPINSIALSASGLRLGSQAPERILSAVERIERATRTLAEMVETLVDSTRVSTGQFRVKPVVIDLVPVVHTAVESMKPAAEAKGITLVAKLRAERTMIHGDPDRLGGNRGGLGLGLSIVKHVVDLHDATIAADSEGKGRGATFTIVLPLVETPRKMAGGQV